MLNLFFAIISSTLVSVFMRLGEGRVKNTMVMFFTNYTVCALTSLYFMGGQRLIPGGAGVPFALGLGLAGGVLFPAAFAVMRLNIRKNGVVLSSIFMKLGVLVPLTMAIVFFREVPGVIQIVGFALAVCAIIIINVEPGKQTAAGSAGLLLLLLLLGGLTDSMVNIYDKLGNPAWKDHFLFYVFAFSALLCLGTAVVQRQSMSVMDVLCGILVGVPNYFSSRFLMLALGSVSAIVAYPVFNVSTIVLISLAGVLAFREKLERRKLVGMGLILISLVLLNM